MDLKHKNNEYMSFLVGKGNHGKGTLKNMVEFEFQKRWNQIINHRFIVTAQAIIITMKLF